MSSLPTTRRVLQVTGPESTTIATRPLPPLLPDTMLIAPTHVALNPTDHKALTGRPSPGSILGCDYTGVVLALGPAPPGGYTREFKVGDRVAGMAYGNNVYDKEDGAFASVVRAKTGTACRVDTLKEEEAAGLGVGVTTIAQGLYQSLGMGLPGEVGEMKGRNTLLVYGGSTATGSLAVQMGKLSGLEVVATCSPHNFDFVKSLGADAVFDYRSPTCGADINKYTNNELIYAFDCISEGSSPAICCEALSSSPPEGVKLQYGILLVVKPEDLPRKDVEPKFTLGYSAFGEKYLYRGVEDQKTEDYVFASNFWGIAEKLLAEGKLKVHPQEVREGGLEAVMDGLKDLKEGRVSGVKLVYRL